MGSPDTVPAAMSKRCAKILPPLTEQEMLPGPWIAPDYELTIGDQHALARHLRSSISSVRRAFPDRWRAVVQEPVAIRQKLRISMRVFAERGVEVCDFDRLACLTVATGVSSKIIPGMIVPCFDHAPPRWFGAEQS